MAGVDADEIVVAGATSRLYLGPVASTAPTDHSTAVATVDADYVDMGYLMDPPKARRDISNKDIEAWNADGPVRTVEESVKEDFTLKLMQVTTEALKLYYRGGTLTGTTSKKFTPSGAGAERTMLIDVVDGSYTYRLWVARLAVVSVGEWAPPKGGALGLEITFRKLEPASGDAELVFTNMPGVA